MSYQRYAVKDKEAMSSHSDNMADSMSPEKQNDGSQEGITGECRFVLLKSWSLSRIDDTDHSSFSSFARSRNPNASSEQS